MIKHANGYDMFKKLKNCKVYVKSFSGSKVRYMKDHMKPSMRGKPDHTILHVGTNYLNSQRPSDLIAKSIVHLAINLKNNSQNVSISNIIMRNDSFNEKAMEVNGYLKQLCIEGNISLIDHTKTILLVQQAYLDRFAPRKKKFIRGNNAPFMNKTLNKEIMKRSNLRNKYFKSGSEEDRQRFRKQRNLCVSLLRKTKRSYYSNLKEKNVIDNRKFWKTVKPMLSNKFVNNEKITLVYNEKITTNDKEIAKVLNGFFPNIIKTLNILKKDHTDSIVQNVRNPTLKAILKYLKHPSILAIKRRINSGPVFTFNHITILRKRMLLKR